MWILLGFDLVGLVGYSLLLRRQAVRLRLHPWVMGTVLQTAATVPALLVALFARPHLSRFTLSTLLLATIAAALTSVLQLAIVKALQHLEASTYAVLYNARIIIATVLAVLFLGESFSLWRAFGGLLILAAIVLLRQKGSQTATRQGVAWGLAAAVAVSLLNIIEKRLINDVGVRTAGPVVVLVGAAAMWAVVWIKRYPVPVRQLFAKPMLGLMVFYDLSAWGFVLALAAGAAVSVATYISSLSVVVIAALGALLLHERDYLLRKAFATGLAVVGLSFLLL